MTKNNLTEDEINELIEAYAEMKAAKEKYEDVQKRLDVKHTVPGSYQGEYGTVKITNYTTSSFKTSEFLDEHPEYNVEENYKVSEATRVSITPKFRKKISRHWF